MRFPGQSWQIIALALLTALTLNGCIAYERNQAIVPDRMFRASDGIQPGRTPASWLTQTLGAPESSQDIDGAEVWRYPVDTSSRTTLQALPLIHVALASEQEAVFCFEISDGVIVRQWRE